MAEEMRLTQERNPANPDLDLGLPREANEMVMKPSESIRNALLMRLTNMSPEELRMLDSVLTPEIARILVKLLPEMQDLMDMVAEGGIPEEMPQEMPTEDMTGMPRGMGALGNV